MAKRALVLAVLAAACIAPATAAAKPYDFDGDGRQDLAVGVPAWPLSGVLYSGGVVVLPGTADGVSLRPQLVSRATPGVPGEPREEETFGSWLASADFDGDGRSDLAVASPTRTPEITVVHGSRRGLGHPKRVKRIRRQTGGPLVAGDMNRDGYADLVSGVNAGYLGLRARIFFGSARGLRRGSARRIRPAPKPRYWGRVIAIGNVNGDRYPDLVEAAPGDCCNIDAGPSPGHVTFCPGSRRGPQHCRPVQGFTVGPSSLAIGDVDGDGYGDVVGGLSTSRYDADDDGVRPPGAVALMRGGRAGPREPVFIDQDSGNVPDEEEPYDYFGRPVSVGDVDADGYADVAVGATGEDDFSGQVTILRGARGRAALLGGYTIGPESAEVPARSSFASALTLLDVDGDRALDLVVGTPQANNGIGGVVILDDGTRRFNGREPQLVAPATLGLERFTGDYQNTSFGQILGGGSSR
jgi:hypothetical protein